MKKFIIILALLAFTCSIDTYGVTAIKKGQQSPTDGFVFSKEEEKTVRGYKENSIKLEQLNVLKNEKIDLQDQRITNLKNHIEDSKPLSTWGKIGYFTLGVVATGLNLYLASKVLEGMK